MRAERARGQRRPRAPRQHDPPRQAQAVRSSSSDAGSTPPSAKMNAGRCRCALGSVSLGAPRSVASTASPVASTHASASDAFGDAPGRRVWRQSRVGVDDLRVQLHGQPRRLARERSASRANAAGRCSSTSTRPMRTGPFAPPAARSRRANSAANPSLASAAGSLLSRAAGTARRPNAPAPPSPSRPARRAARRAASARPPAPPRPPPRGPRCRRRPRTRRNSGLMRRLHGRFVAEQIVAQLRRPSAARSSSSSAPSRQESVTLMPLAVFAEENPRPRRRAQAGQVVRVEHAARPRSRSVPARTGRCTNGNTCRFPLELRRMIHRNNARRHAAHQVEDGVEGFSLILCARHRGELRLHGGDAVSSDAEVLAARVEDTGPRRGCERSARARRACGFASGTLMP